MEGEYMVLSGFPSIPLGSKKKSVNKTFQFQLSVELDFNCYYIGVYRQLSYW